MNEYSKEETKEKILDIMDFLDNGECEMDGVFYKGHPGFYFFHTKEEMTKELDKCLTKEEYDYHDIYYISQKLIKFLLSKYDSHTRLRFINYIQLPLDLKIFDSQIYVSRVSKKLEQLVGGELISINNVPVNTLMKEIEEITCYSTEGYLKQNIEESLILYDVIKSLPSIDNNAESLDFEIKYNGEIKHLNFDENCQNYNHYKKNYVYNLVDDTLVLTYSKCWDFDKMKEFVEEVKKVSEENNINNFVVDIRDNRGGNSEVIKPLLEFLEGKNIVTLVNEVTFSAARMAFVDLKNLGSYSIGTCISTSLNCFGNNTRVKIYDELGLNATGATKYFYYDKNLNKKGFQGKQQFEEFFNDKRELLEPFILYPDEIVNNTLEDIKNSTDSQLEAALNYLKNTRKL